MQEVEAALAGKQQAAARHERSLAEEAARLQCVSEQQQVR